MKLTNQQVSALTDKIHAQIATKVAEENKVLKNNNALFIKWSKDNKKYINALLAMKENAQILKSEEEDDYYSRHFEEMNIDNTLSIKFNATLDLKPTPMKENIRQDIILETIECENIDSIIDKLVSKYTK